MYSIYVALGAGVLVFVAVTLGVSAWAAILPALLVVVTVFLYLFRKYSEKVQAVFNNSVKHLEAQKWEQAIETLSEGYPLAKWMVSAESQIDGQIGWIHYIRKDYDKAFTFLQKSFPRAFMPQLMLAACHFRKKAFQEANEVLERTARYSKETPLVWGVYAWMMVEQGRQDKALEALSAGVKACPTDQALQTNLLNLQNKKKLNMKLFGDIWYQFWFEELPHKRMVPNHPRFQGYQRRR